MRVNGAKFLVLFCAALLSLSFLCSCGIDLDELLNYLNGELASYAPSDETPSENTALPSVVSPTDNAEDHAETPSGGITHIKLPTQSFSSDIEREASEIADESIERALSAVEYLKDGNKSYVSYPYDTDPLGLVSAMSPEERKAFGDIISAAKSFGTFKLTTKEFSGDMKSFYFSLGKALEYNEPAVASYMDFMPDITLDWDTDETIYKGLDMYLFDPNRDENVRVSPEGDAYVKLKHDIALMEEIIKRVISFMPGDLSTYDRYYYLAAFLSEHVTYYGETDNAWTAYGAIVGRKCVCEGYSYAYALLCKEADLYCSYRYGNGHQWNYVRLEDGYYNVDVTWCDNGSASYEKGWFKNFMKTDAEFSEIGHKPSN